MHRTEINSAEGEKQGRLPGSLRGRMAITGCWLADGKIPQKAGCPCNRAQNRTNAVRFLRPVVFRDGLLFGGISRPQALQACNGHAPLQAAGKPSLPLPLRKMDFRSCRAH